MAASVDSAEGDIGFQIAPMVDVVFVLMLFFMAATGAQVLTKELHAQLPSPPHPGAIQAPAIVEIAAGKAGVGNVTFSVVDKDGGGPPPAGN